MRNPNTSKQMTGGETIMRITTEQPEGITFVKSIKHPFNLPPLPYLKY
jgi:hypothetical protein